MVRYGWLNALLIGATILVWLTLVGAVVSGVLVGVWAATSDDELTFELDSGEGNSRYFERAGVLWWRDMNGDECPVEQTVTRAGVDEAVCP